MIISRPELSRDFLWTRARKARKRTLLLSLTATTCVHCSSRIFRNTAEVCPLRREKVNKKGLRLENHPLLHSIPLYFHLEDPFCVPAYAVFFLLSFSSLLTLSVVFQMNSYFLPRYAPESEEGRTSAEIAPEQSLALRGIIHSTGKQEIYSR